MILEFILVCLFYLLSIVLHELGHLIAFRKLKLKPKLKFTFGEGFVVGENYHYRYLSLSEYKFVHSAGILLGLVPIIISSIYFSAWGLLLIPYFYGCRYDIKNILEAKKNE